MSSQIEVTEALLEELERRIGVATQARQRYAASEHPHISDACESYLKAKRDLVDIDTISALVREVRAARNAVPAWAGVLVLNRACPAFCGEHNCPFDYSECEEAQSDGGVYHTSEECWRELDKQQHEVRAVEVAK